MKHVVVVEKGDRGRKGIVAAKCFYVQSSVLAEVLDELDAVRGEK